MKYLTNADKEFLCDLLKSIQKDYALAHISKQDRNNKNLRKYQRIDLALKILGNDQGNYHHLV